MRITRFWSTNSSFDFYKAILLFLVLHSFNSQAHTTMTTPPILQKGDTIAILATARKNIDDNLQPAIDLLHSWGLEVVIGNTIGLDNNQLAGTDAQRASDFQKQLDNPNIKAIWCVKGGYGTVRIIDMLDFTKFKQSPKWIVGFSDITVLHNHLNTMGYKTIHGIMPITYPRATTEAVESLKLALFGNPIRYEITPDPMNRFGTASGEIVGGNLSILYSLLGSNSAIDCKDKILFIEDLDEYLYHIDRMMMNLKRNGCLESIKGIIVGSMSKMKDNDIPWGKNAIEIIEDITKQYRIPVVYNFPAGHIRDNRALVLGSVVHIEVTAEKSILQFE
ncbi:muramoyltetrapeptide carboxypeptidase [Flavobacterium frigoris]|uniref:Muramoyltetrapeptide carboxypeptidase n=2 Tax=Flavobacterium frigoris TaxID=229204 RepID=A0A1H9CZ07_FLAFI|nr:muramoyltetrapeptide carboxypeptidase [Flavobacterium frigoris]